MVALAVLAYSRIGRKMLVRMVILLELDIVPRLLVIGWSTAGVAFVVLSLLFTHLGGKFRVGSRVTL